MNRFGLRKVFCAKRPDARGVDARGVDARGVNARGVNARGVAAVEFALVLPLLLVILLGILDYGWVYFVKMNLTNAAREGARVGVTRSAATAKTDAETAATAYLQSAGINTGGGYVSVSATTPSDATPTVTVQVTIPSFQPLVDFVPTPSTLSATAAMRWELGP